MVSTSTARETGKQKYQPPALLRARFDREFESMIPPAVMRGILTIYSEWQKYGVDVFTTRAKMREYSRTTEWEFRRALEISAACGFTERGLYELHACPGQGGVKSSTLTIGVGWTTRPLVSLHQLYAHFPPIDPATGRFRRTLMMQEWVLEQRAKTRRGGARPGAGRPKGSRSKISVVRLTSNAQVAGLLRGLGIQTLKEEYRRELRSLSGKNEESAVAVAATPLRPIEATPSRFGSEKIESPQASGFRTATRDKHRIPGFEGLWTLPPRRDYAGKKRDRSMSLAATSETCDGAPQLRLVVEADDTHTRVTRLLGDDAIPYPGVAQYGTDFYRPAAPKLPLALLDSPRECAQILLRTYVGFVKARRGFTVRPKMTEAMWARLEAFGTTLCSLRVSPAAWMLWSESAWKHVTSGQPNAGKTVPKLAWVFSLKRMQALRAGEFREAVSTSCAAAAIVFPKAARTAVEFYDAMWNELHRADPNTRSEALEILWRYFPPGSFEAQMRLARNESERQGEWYATMIEDGEFIW